MSTKLRSRAHGQKANSATFTTNLGRKMKAKMVINKASLSLPDSRKSSSRPLKEKCRRVRLSSSQSTLSHRKENYVHTPGSLKNSPAGRKKKTTQSEVKQRVLRTISQMLHENRIIRKQWLSD